MKTIRNLATAVLLTCVSFSIFAGHHKQAKDDIVTIAASNDTFSTLVTAIEAAGITDILKDAGPYTVFAPTNAAFEALPAGTLDKLLKPANKEALVQVLTYHVVSGKFTADRVTGLSEATTVEGAVINISSDMGKVMVENATVVKTDIMASNGVIHVIDQVLVPDSVAKKL
ncbi:fasciclin domain-containing protein [Alteromonas sp. ASW11-19]|uniref:Fasciclin domain-containing protein n=1 Tax=Alteromonas salexigens TaxID=2982530 RepID=A0ABT2VMJ4_9ALTE|nr:fasciclin domain-containing protein [Alteromonas salexigens]MCU7553693.1 fasciclin domain-containing protein [Alteromonas salexigens]